MTRIHGSRHTFLEADDEKAIEFLDIVADITEVEDYRRLKNFIHHRYTTRYQHCLNVAWYSYLMAKRAGLDYVSCARGAMLHDFYLYRNGSTHLPMEGSHAEVHPKIALQNAKKYYDVNPIMEDCILRHMWPSGGEKPLTPEGYIVTVADKYAASIEVTAHYWRRLRRELAF